MAAQDTIQAIGTEIGKALLPLRNAVSSSDAFVSFMAGLGWDLSAVGAVPTSFQNLLTNLGLLADTLEDMIAGEELDADEFMQIVNAVKSVNSDIEKLKTAADLPGDLIAANFQSIFPRQLVDLLIVNYLSINQPIALYLLGIVGIYRVEYKEPDGIRPAYISRTIAWEDLPKIFDDPAITFKNAYMWGQDDFDAASFFMQLQDFFVAIGAHVFLEGQDPDALAKLNDDNALDDDDSRLALKCSIFDLMEADKRLQAGLGLFALPKVGTLEPGLSLLPYIKGSFEQQFGITEELFFAIKAAFDIQGGVGLVLRPDRGMRIIVGLDNPASAMQASGSLEARLEHKQAAGQPIILIGSADGSRLQMNSLSLATGVYVDSTADPDIYIEIELEGGKIVIKAGQGDGFLQKILPENGITTNFELALGWSLKRNVYFRGSGGLEIQVPTHVKLGPIELMGVTVAANASNGDLPIQVGASVKALLGPLNAVVENMGIEAKFSFPGSGGNLGPIDLALGFKPPSGVGLSIDAEAVKGGGFLSFDVDNERYTGALELVVSGFLTLKAIGLITTKMPDGSKGFSLLVIITAEFGSTGYQLGYGFTLLGVGGLLGLNRTMCLEPLAEGVRTGAVNRIMFPTNIVQNATRIISDLRTFFPAEEGKFLIGPMAKLGWGTPTLISLSLGIIIEIPSDFAAIVGVLKVILPDEKAPLLRLQVNFIGVIEFDKKRAYLIAALFESRVLFMTIEGEMGVLVAWGKDANFVVSVGGFHPQFNPPPLPFSEPKRIAISILNTSVAKIRVEGYFAVTSNTVQFGARAELYFGMSAFNIDGQLAFDALFQFSPFYFIIQISASLSVKVFGVGLLSVRIRGSLEGPTPWHIEGTGSISLLLCDIEVDFSHTWGEEADTILPPIQVMPLLKAEFEKLENWQAKVPAANNILVSLRMIGYTEGLVMHPVGSLKVSQRMVPLELTIDKVGAQKPSDANKFTISVDNSSGLHKEDEAEEMFAMAQFKDMSDSKKLSAPAYEKKISGVVLSVSGEQMKTTCAIKRVVRYEEIIIDSNFKRFVKPFFKFFGVLFNLFLNGNAITQSTLSNKYKKQRMPFEDMITIVPNLYVVANNIDNTPFSEEAKAFTSYTAAEEYMNGQVQEDPNLQDSLHVIPRVEMQGVL